MAYAGLGVIPAAVPISIEVGKKLTQLLGGKAAAANKKVIDAVASHYQSAIAGDITALEWLYTKSGGHDPLLPPGGAKAKWGTNKSPLSTGTGWRVNDMGGDLTYKVIQATGMRKATYEYYADAAQKIGQPVKPPGFGATMFRLNNIDTPVYQSTAPAEKKKMILVPEAAAHPTYQTPQPQQAGLLGMDIGSVPVLASLGFIALAFILRER